MKHYGWEESEGWTDAEVEEMWAHVDVEAWGNMFDGNDAIREEYFKGEPHWYLASLMTWPEWQGRGIGRLLLDDGIGVAEGESPELPLYLESSDMARAVYRRMGFEPIGKKNMVRRVREERKVEG